MRNPRRIVVLAVVSVAALLASAATAVADSAPQAFHTLVAPLSAVGNAPLHSGWVSDSHANSPTIGAHEEYHVDGASPNTTYQVVIQFYAGVTGCPGGAAAIPTASITTNASGNGNGDWVFPGSPGAPITQNSAIWQLVGPGNVVDYQTDCQLVVIGG
ncbi:MAG: hypothetical protein J2P28_02420 [Actinobacteria bacterium]|nr:hypothetical protein [Actinomycetota bacterium]MBO0834357.1 hypothetical protein [Actinomycetota bacterium]